APEGQRERLKWSAHPLPVSRHGMVQMHYLAGLSPDEIERICELPEGEARRQLDEADRLLPAVMRGSTMPRPDREYHLIEIENPRQTIGEHVGQLPAVALRDALAQVKDWASRPGP